MNIRMDRKVFSMVTKRVKLFLAKLKTELDMAASLLITNRLRLLT